MSTLLRWLRTWTLQLFQALSVELSYRLAFLQTMASDAFGMVGILAFWLAVAKARTTQAGYSPGLIVGYFLVATCMSILCEDGMSRLISLDIRLGRLSASLVRPHPFFFGVVARAVSYVLVRSAVLLPIILCTFFAIDELRAHMMSMSAAHWLAFFAASLLGLACGWTVKAMVGFLAFRLTQTWGPELIYMALFNLASGERYPPDILPAMWAEVLHWTPMYYMVGFPSLILLGRIPSNSWGPDFIQGLCVLGVSSLIAIGFWRRGLNRFEAVGI